MHTNPPKSDLIHTAININNTFINLKFIKIYTNHNININSLYNSHIPIKWQLLLMSDGSFTQDLTSLTGESVKANIINQSRLNNQYCSYQNKYFAVHYDTLIREVFLEDAHNHKLAFARSFWNIDHVPKHILQNNMPVGQSLINLEVNFHKKICEICCGYSNYMNSLFHTNEMIWCRVYTIYHNNQDIAIIHEYLSPLIINYFKI